MYVDVGKCRNGRIEQGLYLCEDDLLGHVITKKAVPHIDSKHQLYTQRRAQKM